MGVGFFGFLLSPDSASLPPGYGWWGIGVARMERSGIRVAKRQRLSGTERFCEAVRRVPGPTTRTPEAAELNYPAGSPTNPVGTTTSLRLLETMLRCRKAAVAHGGGVSGNGAGDTVAVGHEVAHEFRAARRDAEQVVQDQHLRIGIRAGANADHRNAYRAGDLRRQRRGH